MIPSGKTAHPDLAAETTREPRAVRTSSGVETVDFHGLSRSVQERFVQCVRGLHEPKPIAAEKVRSRAPLGWSLLIVTASLALLVFLLAGFGDLESPRALHRGAWMPAYAALGAAVALGVVQLVALRARRRSLPFDRGVYVFPVSLVDARARRMRIFSLADVLSVEVEPEEQRVVRVVFASGDVFTFTSERATADAARIERAREEARVLRSLDDPRVTVTFSLDPLQRPRISGLLGPRAGLGRPTPGWTERAWIAAPVLGTALAFPLLLVRDAASDRRMYLDALARDDVGAYRAYLAHGGKKSDYVSQILLPRAELREAEQARTVAAIDAYIAAHPGSAIGAEVAAARKKALLEELARGKSVGTVAALHDFAQNYPDSGLDADLRAAIHDLFVPALVAYHDRPPPRPEVRAFVDRLFAWSEAKAHAGSASTLRIRFRTKPSPTLRRADQMIGRHSWFIGEASYPSRYFDAMHAVARERELAAVIGRSMRDAFGAGVFTVEQGDRLEDGGGPLPAVTEPTLFITHEESWRGPFDGSITKPRGVWVAVTYRFETAFVIPGEREPLTFELEIPQKLPQEVISENPLGGTPQAPLEEKIYGTMTEKAYVIFRDKYLASLLPAAK